MFSLKKDLYSWIRQQLLQQDILSPGTELMLSHNNLSFPLKANTANKALGNLPATSFLCEEIKKVSLSYFRRSLNDAVAYDVPIVNITTILLEMTSVS